ncbi:MAG TPA: DUF1214 domain-containing protein, partial [Ktedonobacteraceae bacterium]|nr:DUF1214 domain-containing protein [Ktedonobacteraceae bacterium]
PLIVSHPDSRGRYFVMQLMNMWTDEFGSVGSRTTGTGPGNFLIAGPKWNGTTPPDIKETYRSSTRFAWVLVQTVAHGPEDFQAVVALESDYKLTPLSAWGKPNIPYMLPDRVPIDPTVDTTAYPFDQVRLMDAGTFFKRLALLLKDNPPYEADAPMLKKLKSIGVEPGEDFDIEKLDRNEAGALRRAVRHVWGLFESAPMEMPNVNGWILPLNLGRYGTDYSTRAFIAYCGLGALQWEDAIYPTAFVDGGGRPLDGTSKYTMHFEKGGLFPSHSGVWSISAYRENFYVRNALERYGIASWMPLVYNADGSLDVYIQASSPGADKEANWLPCPPGGVFNVSIRVYWPEEAMIDGRTKDHLMVEAGTYQIPPLMRVP